MIEKVRGPARIPAPGDKVIEEYIGRVNSGTARMSIARMLAPPGWTEPFQKPEFDEATIVLRGRLRLDHEGGSVEVAAGEAIYVEAGDRIRYSNPFDEDAEYWAICVPAFHPDDAGREE